MQKEYNIKVYNGSTYDKTLNPRLVMSAIKFTSQINGGQGQLTLDLATKYDEDYVTSGQVVRVYEANTNRLIYTGVVSQVIRLFQHREYVQVIVLGLASLMTRTLYRDGGSGYVRTITDDPAEIVRDVVDEMNMQYNLFSYGSEVVNVGFTRQIKTDYDNKLSVINKARAIAPLYYWTIEPTGNVHFRPETYTGQTTHFFTVGVDVENMTIENDSEKIVNRVFVRYSGGGVEDSEDSTSISTYGLFEGFINDSKIGNSATAQTVADNHISENKDPKRRIVLVINDIYDIESVKIGDRVTVRNTSIDISDLLIQKIEYNINKIRIELEQSYSLAEEITKL